MREKLRWVTEGAANYTIDQVERLNALVETHVVRISGRQNASKAKVLELYNSHDDAVQKGQTEANRSDEFRSHSADIELMDRLLTVRLPSEKASGELPMVGHELQFARDELSVEKAMPDWWIDAKFQPIDVSLERAPMSSGGVRFEKADLERLLWLIGAYDRLHLLITL